MNEQAYLSALERLKLADTLVCCLWNQIVLVDLVSRPLTTLSSKHGKQDGKAPQQLMMVSGPTFPAGCCDDRNGFNYKVSDLDDTMFCMGGDNGDGKAGDACQVCEFSSLLPAMFVLGRFQKFMF